MLYTVKVKNHFLDYCQNCTTLCTIRLVTLHMRQMSVSYATMEVGITFVWVLAKSRCKFG